MNRLRGRIKKQILGSTSAENKAAYKKPEIWKGEG